MMVFAKCVATRSTCQRLQVGCVLTDPLYELVTMGYNGTFRGGPNTCFLDPDTPGGCGCCHAEANAIAKAPRGPKIAFLTHSPCVPCATLLVNAGVIELWYETEYRLPDAFRLLEQAHVDVRQLTVVVADAPLP